MDIRSAVYEANMELKRQGLVLYTWGNVSQVDRVEGVMVIKPSGVPYEKLSPDNMVVVSLSDGRVLSGGRASSDAPTHLHLYRAFPEVGGIAHTHSTYATAWAQAGCAIPAMGTTHADYFFGPVPITRELTDTEVAGEYEKETGVVIAEAFGNLNPVYVPGVLVRGHGPFAWGEDAAEAAYHATVLEEVARMAYIARTLNPGAPLLSDAVARRHFERKHGPNAYYGQR